MTRAAALAGRWSRPRDLARRLFRPGAEGVDRLVSAGFLLAIAVLVAAAIWQSAALLQAWADNRAIRALAAGQAAELRENAPPEVLFAAASRRFAANDLEAAEALGARFEIGPAHPLRAAFRYNLANERMRAAFDLIDRNAIDEATVIIRLAQEDYRRAMRLAPDAFDIKYNFDLASRLVRVFPRTQIEPEGEGEPPDDVWTNLPGVPRGLP